MYSRFVHRIVAVAALLLLGGWGTLTEPIDPGPGVEEELRGLFRDYGRHDKQKWLDELTDRGARHPVHQFIVYQAYLLLKEDPAFADNASGFPTVEQINAWDGIERAHGFMVERPLTSTTSTPGLAPTRTPSVGGAGADAERTRTPQGWNKKYNGRAHYWNPWLDDGEAPRVAGENFSRLVHSIAEDGDMNMRAHFAAYMAHYVSDVTSAKHADAFTLDDATLQELDRIANRWAKGTDLMDMLGDPELKRAEQLLRSRVNTIDFRVAPAYWARVDARVDRTLGSYLFRRVSGTFELVDIPPRSMLTSTACYLHGLGNRPQDQPLDQFYTYFDPFYFNGPLIDSAHKPPIWEMCVAFSEHLQWESNPTHFKTALAAMQVTPKLWDASLGGSFRALKRPPELFSPDPDTAKDAMGTAMADMTKQCSRDAHGDIGADRDFEVDHEEYLKLAIQCVYTAFRASITALRVEAYGRKMAASETRGTKKGGSENVRLVLDVKNLAAKPAKLSSAKVSGRDASGKLVSRKGWTVALDGKTVAGGSTERVQIQVEDVPADMTVDALVVDVHGDVADTPDSGWRRAKVEDREIKLVRNPKADKPITEKEGPVDVIIVIDTTGSMQSSIDSMRTNAIASIKKLREKSKDIRLAITTFRDLAEKGDRPHFKVKAFSSDLEAGFNFLNGLKADGGGDTPEDLLHGVSLGIALWEKEGAKPGRIPTKVIVVITDAPARSPDSRGNTWDSIRQRAHKVDPAHIYPIIVGSDPTALEHAQILADKTGGKVLTAATGDEVAQAVLDAVETAATEHGDDKPSGTDSDAWALTWVGVVALLVGTVLLVFVARRGHREEATHVGPH